MDGGMCCKDDDCTMVACRSCQRPVRRRSTTRTAQQRQQPVQPQPAGIFINTIGCKFPVVSRVALSLGWKETEDESKWDVMWVDAGMGVEKVVRTMKSYQRLNHFPGMINIYRKDKLAKSLSKMRRMSNLYDFMPRTWFLPADFNNICNYLRSGPSKAVILKPCAGAQGKGIFLATTPDEVFIRHDEQYIVQSYFTKPFLVDSFKFDLRVYVLVVSCDPLRILLYRDGLCRFCTTPYFPPTSENVNDTFMHLTNYSINKHNEGFAAPTDIHNSDSGSKRPLSWLWDHLQSLGFDDRAVRSRIADIAVKTLISVQAKLARQLSANKAGQQNRNPFSCFEVLGLDILLTEVDSATTGGVESVLEPVLLEVNHMPSFATDSPLDYSVKASLLTDTFKLLNISANERQEYFAQAAAQSQLRLYGELLPTSSGPFSSSPRLSKKHYIQPTERSYWQTYLDNEREQLHDHDNGFDLIYPADVYDHQLTTGLQPVYDDLLLLADCVERSGGSFASLKAYGNQLPSEILAESDKKQTKTAKKQMRRKSMDLALLQPLAVSDGGSAGNSGVSTPLFSQSVRVVQSGGSSPLIPPPQFAASAASPSSKLNEVEAQLPNSPQRPKGDPNSASTRSSKFGGRRYHETNIDLGLLSEASATSSVTSDCWSDDYLLSKLHLQRMQHLRRIAEGTESG